MLTRRQFLQLAGATAVTSAAGCSMAGREVARRQLPADLTTAVSAATPDPLRRFINRAGYGPTPETLLHAQALGLAAYLEEQLHPETINDTAADLMARALTLYQMDPTQLAAQDEKDALAELIGSTAARARYSRCQLYEAMVEFWSDHFHIYVRKEKILPQLKILHDRDAIRPHALGRFRHLLGASAKSGAMLVYLDNVQNEKSHPNENYARELLELHTVGVDGGYTQQDVQALARALTGWTVGRRGRSQGQWRFDAARHDDGPKQIMDLHLPAGSGAQGMEQTLDYLAAHPETARFIAHKLVRRFVADDPPPALVAQVAQTFLATDGDVKSLLRVIFLSDDFAAAPPKLKRPFTFAVSALRALHVDLSAGGGRELAHWLRRLGQLPFHWPPPDGYPDTSAAWAANLLPRWNFALALLHGDVSGAPPLPRLAAAGRVAAPAEALHLFSGLINGRSLTPAEQQLYGAYAGNGRLADRETQLRLQDCAALMLAGPDFQWT